MKYYLKNTYYIYLKKNKICSFPHPKYLLIETDTDKILYHPQCMTFHEIIIKSEVIFTKTYLEN